MKKFIEDFKKFAVKGNVVDMAVGIIIGAAFGKIVTSLVNDVITPPLGIIVGGVDFKDLKFVLKAAKGNAPAVTLNYGNFIQCTIDFIIVAIAIAFPFLKKKAAFVRQKSAAQKKLKDSMRLAEANTKEMGGDR